MKRKLEVAIGLLAMSLSACGDVSSVATSSVVAVDATFVDHTSIDSTMPITYGPLTWDLECSVSLNGAAFISSTNRSTFTWQPRQLGENVLVWSSAGVTMTSTVNVERLTFYVQPEPNPPMPVDANITITPETRTIEQGGGGGSIITSGSGTWTAAASEPWIVLNTTSGSVGNPVAYIVNASALVGDRVGYVYVSGRVHTVTQHGYTSTISPASAEFETQGGSGTVAIQTTNRIAWNAKPNADWITITPTSGTGSGTINYTVAPYNEVATRTGTITVGDQTFTVRQTGRRIKLSTYREVRTDYFSHVIPVTVNALASTHWSVTPNASWISVVDAGNGVGGDSVSLAIADNLNGVTRYGTVTIGTETLLIVQGEPITITPETATADENGANGFIAVGAWPEVSWVASIKSNWLTILGNTAQGTGCGNVVYTASPNPTLYERTGIIEVVENGSKHGYPVRTHTVIQPAATATVSPKGYEFEAGGGSCSVFVDTESIVRWKVEGCPNWLTVPTGAEGIGPQTIRLQAAENNTIYSRTATLKIAENSFVVTQKGRGVEVEYDSILFGTDGGLGSFSIHPDGDVAWQAVSSDPTWITVFQNDSGTGDAAVTYIVSPYVGNSAARTGYIAVGDKKVYITQRPYDMNIDPYLAEVTGDAGLGSVNVFAPNGSVWDVIATEPWIKVITKTGSGNGTVAYQFTENLTGKVRSGKIIISGEEHTLTQTYGVPETLHNPVIIPSDGSIFKTDTCIVTITTATKGATIYYSTNGRTPRTSVENLYSSPFAISDTATIVAVAVKDGETSEYVEATITKVIPEPLSLVGVLDEPKLAGVITGGDAEWMPIDDETAVIGGSCAVSGMLDDAGIEESTWLEAKVCGKGTLTFYWRVSCEPDPRAERFTFDYATFEADDEVVVQKDGETGWIQVTKTFITDGEHVIRWIYNADGYPCEDYDGCVWVDGVTWSVEGTGEDLVPLEDPVIEPASGATFSTDTCTVTITCATPNAVIYYSTNGQVPLTTESCRYKGPFTITGTTTIKAVAVRDEEKSEYVSSIITKIDPDNYTDAVVGKDVTGLDEPVTVSATWVTDFLVQHFGTGKVDSFRQLFGGDLAAALAKPTGKHGPSGEVRTVWDDYVAGTDPTDPASVFTTTIAIVDGKVVLDWSPNLNLGSVNRLYRVKSKLKLSDTWTCPPVADHHFFMTEVALPDGKTQTASPGVIGNVSSDGDGEANKLAHRWSFNGNLNDSVGNRTATAVGSVSSDGTTYTLSGGYDIVAYIDLGTGLFVDGVTEFTIETWVTPYATGWRRIWDMADLFGQCWNGKDNLMGVRDHVSWTSYTTDVKTYIAVVCTALPSGGWSLIYYHLDSETGATLSSNASTTVGSDWSPQKVGVNALLLGKSNAPQDPYGNASYDEFRIWNKALSEDELKKSVEKGPDTLP